MGVIVNIVGSNISNVKFDGVAIESGFEITKNGTLTFECSRVPAYINDTPLYTGGTFDYDASSVSEIEINNETMGFVGMTHSFTVNITGVQTAITQLGPFLTNIANAIRNKKGTTAPINAQDFASEIASIEGGGSGGATLKVSWTGTAVPVDTNTTIQNVYFNTQASNEEVAICFNEYFKGNEDEEKLGFILFGQNTGVGIGITSSDGVNVIQAVQNDNPIFIYAYDTTGKGRDIAEAGFSGWNPDFNGMLVINDTPSSYISGVKLEDNEIIKPIISITPFKNEQISLTGDYNGVMLNITNNGSVEFKQNIIDNKEIVYAININVGIKNKLFFKGTITLADTLTIEEFTGFYSENASGGEYISKDTTFNSEHLYCCIHMILTSSKMVALNVQTNVNVSSTSTSAGGLQKTEIFLFPYGDDWLVEYSQIE